MANQSDVEWAHQSGLLSSYRGMFIPGTTHLQHTCARPDAPHRAFLALRPGAAARQLRPSRGDPQMCLPAPLACRKCHTLRVTLGTSHFFFKIPYTRRRFTLLRRGFLPSSRTHDYPSAHKALELPTSSIPTCTHVIRRHFTSF